MGLVLGLMGVGSGWVSPILLGWGGGGGGESRLSVNFLFVWGVLEIFLGYVLV